MGGLVRRLFRTFGSVPAAPPQIQQAQQVAITKGVSSARVSKPYMDETIMTGGTGLEEEANVQKTVLGGTTTKKKKYKV